MSCPLSWSPLYHFVYKNTQLFSDAIVTSCEQQLQNSAKQQREATKQLQNSQNQLKTTEEMLESTKIQLANTEYKLQTTEYQLQTSDEQLQDVQNQLIATKERAERLERKLENLESSQPVCDKPTGSMKDHTSDSAKNFVFSLVRQVKNARETDICLGGSLGSGYITVKQRVPD